MKENICHIKSCFPKDEVYKRSLIMEHYGIQTQLFKMVEELTEAQTEVIKLLSGKPDKSLEHLIEELADVALLTDQIIEHYGQRYQFKQVYDYKLQRTLERIKGDHNA
jgi:hypothetical protein